MILIKDARSSGIDKCDEDGDNWGEKNKDDRAELAVAFIKFDRIESTWWEMMLCVLIRVEEFSELNVKIIIRWVTF